MNNYIFIESGMVLRSESGRILSPVPNLSGSVFTQRKRFCLWLADEVEREIEHREDVKTARYRSGYYAPIENMASDAIKEMRQPTGRKFGKRGTHKYYGGPALDNLLFVLFGDSEGPAEKHLVK